MDPLPHLDAYNTVFGIQSLPIPHIGIEQLCRKQYRIEYNMNFRLLWVRYN